jgi:hypothetical protein|nr:MAG TPA: hypothetical protein [Caudoviricetes sp.]
MDEYTAEELAAMAQEAWDEAFCKLPPVPYFEAFLDAIESAAEVENYPNEQVETLYYELAFAVRSAAAEGHGIDYLDNELREVMERRAATQGWFFLNDHLKDAREQALRLEQERMPLGEENADDAH